MCLPCSDSAMSIDFRAHQYPGLTSRFLWEWLLWCLVTHGHPLFWPQAHQLHWSPAMRGSCLGCGKWLVLLHQPYGQQLFQVLLSTPHWLHIWSQGNRARRQTWVRDIVLSSEPPHPSTAAVLLVGQVGLPGSFFLRTSFPSILFNS